MPAASNEYRPKLLATVHDVAEVLMVLASRLRELRTTVAQSETVHASEMFDRMMRAESEIKRIARLISWNA
jgi:hypothetical protein